MAGISNLFTVSAKLYLWPLKKVDDLEVAEARVVTEAWYLPSSGKPNLRGSLFAIFQLAGHENLWIIFT
jgi:hypothetical protein